MSDQIIEGKRRKMSEKSDLKLDESSVDLTRDKILEREFARIKDVSQHQQIVQTFNCKFFYFFNICETDSPSHQPFLKN